MHNPQQSVERVTYKAFLQSVYNAPSPACPDNTEPILEKANEKEAIRVDKGNKDDAVGSGKDTEHSLSPLHQRGKLNYMALVKVTVHAKLKSKMKMKVTVEKRGMKTKQ
ncbi:hypothetical protein U1Q18_048867 [Sarracenia purpurea var. burkii]